MLYWHPLNSPLLLGSSIWDLLLIRDYFSIWLVAGFIFLFFAVAFLLFTQIDQSKWFTRRTPPDDSVFYISFSVFFAISIACFVLASLCAKDTSFGHRVIVLSCQPADANRIKLVVDALHKRKCLTETKPNPPSAKAIANNPNSTLRFFNAADREDAEVLVQWLKSETGISLTSLDFSTRPSFSDRDEQFRNRGYFEVWLNN